MNTSLARLNFTSLVIFIKLVISIGPQNYYSGLMGERVGGWVGEWFPTAAIIRLSQPSLAGVGAEISNNFNGF